MRRVAALCFAALMAVILAVLRSGIVPAWNSIQIGALDAAHLMPIGIVAATVIIAVLCYQKQPAGCSPSGGWKNPCGWFATFSGVILLIGSGYGVLSYITSKIVPPITVSGVASLSIASEQQVNTTDRFAFLAMVLFGIAGGIFLAILGFQWMADSKTTPAFLPWLSITPSLWMWFRLARYEISYASIVDISENVFDFAKMVFIALFLFQLARATMGIGKVPKNGLLIFALCTAMVSLSGIPSEFVKVLNSGETTLLLTTVTDTVLGLFAGVYAAMIVLERPKAVSADKTVDAQAWETPDEQPPVDPPFDIDAKLPEETVEEAAQDLGEETTDELVEVTNDDKDNAVVASDTAERKYIDTNQEIDDILAELNK